MLLSTSVAVMSARASCSSLRELCFEQSACADLEPVDLRRCHRLCPEQKSRERLRVSERRHTSVEVRDRNLGVRDVGGRERF
jgi:hypothetical protein